ncbi:hypothetical protein CKL25_14980 [Salmonella enterica subsp. enterica serovar Weltevreden]|nr:hypothetical protein [Salmonella enterica subsp. enterica serovar Weltevreden]
MSLFRNGSFAAGKRLEVFQGNGGNPAMRTGKRLAAGRKTGTSRYRARDGCGSGAGNPRECALLFARLKIAGECRSLSCSC